MVNKERIEQLEQYLLAEPNDPFIKYALAMEYMDEDIQKTLDYFENLLNNHEKYVATYFHAASLYASVGDIDKAEETYKKGIIVASELKEMHALKELKAAFLNFQIEND
ncbi:MAG: tetratricopeptide repeat protein [Cyclobacteriaceae bacterium]